MWIITPRGFFSAVEKKGDREADMVTVRARVKADLENLPVVPFPEPVIETGKGDYAYRIRIRKAHWAAMVAVMVVEIDYSNFKDEVTKRQGHNRHDHYMNVWRALGRLQPGGPYSGGVARAPRDFSDLTHQGMDYQGTRRSKKGRKRGGTRPMSGPGTLFGPTPSELSLTEADRASLEAEADRYATEEDSIPF